MNTVYILLGTFASSMVVFAGLARAIRWIGKFVDAVEENTKATGKLSAEFAAHSTTVVEQLTDHAARLTALETTR